MLHQTKQSVNAFITVRIIIIIILWLASFQCIAPFTANNLQTGLSIASSVASSTLRLWDDRSFFIVASQKVWGRLLPAFWKSFWQTAVRILLASANSSILAKCPNSIRCLFWIIEVRGGCSVNCYTSWLVNTRWYQHILRILLRHHWSSASMFWGGTSLTWSNSKKLPTESSFF